MVRVRVEETCTVEGRGEWTYKRDVERRHGEETWRGDVERRRGEET